MPQRKDSSGKVWNDACDFRVQVGMVKNNFLFQDSSGVKNVTTKSVWGTV